MKLFTFCCVLLLCFSTAFLFDTSVNFNETTIEHSQLVFNDEGRLYAPSDILNVNINLNISQLYLACDKYKEYGERLTQHIADLDSSLATDPQIHAALAAARTKLNHLCETPILFRTLVLRAQAEAATTRSEFEDVETREKRAAILAAIGIGAIIASTGLGIYNSVQLSHLNQAALDHEDRISALQDQIYLLSASTARLFSLEEDIEQVYSSILELILAIDEKITTKLEIQAAISEFNYYTQVLQNYVEKFETGFSQLQNNKLSLDLINPGRLVDLWQNVTEKATPQMKELFQHPFDLLQLPASYTVHESGTLRIFLHVPLAAKTFNLWKHVPFPILPVDVDIPIMARPKTGNTFLAITTDQLQHRELSAAMLAESCYNYNKNFICDDLSFFDKKPDASCLSSLFTNHLTNLEEKCDIFTYPGNFASHHLAFNRFLVFSRHAVEYKRTCQNEIPRVTSHTLHHHQTLELKPHCTLDSPSFHVQPTAMSYLKTTVNFKIRINFTSLAGGTTLKEARFLRERIAKLTTAPEQRLHDIVQEAKTALAAVRHFPHVGTNLVLAALTAICVFTITLVCCCSQSLRREFKIRIHAIAMAFRIANPLFMPVVNHNDQELPPPPPPVNNIQ